MLFVLNYIWKQQPLVIVKGKTLLTLWIVYDIMSFLPKLDT
jgi:hypothetical protein